MYIMVSSAQKCHKGSIYSGLEASFKNSNELVTSINEKLTVSVKFLNFLCEEIQQRVPL